MKGEVEALAHKKVIQLKERCVPVCLQPVFALDNVHWKPAVATLHGCSCETPLSLVNGELRS